MRIKINGIGKCGVRIAYDLFAYTNGLSSSYEIRLDPALKPGLRRRARNIIRQTWEHIAPGANRLLRIAEPPEYVTIESDSQNNEIISRKITNVQIKNVIVDDSSPEEQIVEFPGTNYRLNEHEGGCNFHVISESLARSWQMIPEPITSAEEVGIYVVSFSIAGGTGGGTAGVICQSSRLQRPDGSPICHYMGLGVLPKSDETYSDNDIVPSMSDYEKFNAGRFLVSSYGNRIPESMNSLWLFSNDILRFLMEGNRDQEILTRVGGEMEINFSLVNFYVAQSLTVLANSSSVLTKADTNLDPRELNDFLSGRPFVSAMAQRRPERGGDLEKDVVDVKHLLARALGNASVRDRRVEGLSVPVRKSDLEPISKILTSDSADYGEFLRALRDYKENYQNYQGPVEFRTTYRLAILYGQPESERSETKKDMITAACEAFFPNSQKLTFTFSHGQGQDVLLLFLVDPFVRSAVSAVYYYANNAWCESGENYTDEFDQAIGEEEFKEPGIFNQREIFPEVVYGGGVAEVEEKVKEDPPLGVDREQVIAAFRHLHRVYHRRRPATRTSSKLT